MTEGILRRPFAVVTILVFVLAVPFGLVCFFYVSNNRNYLIERDLRLLRLESGRFKSQIELYTGTVLNNLLDTAAEYCSSTDLGRCQLATLPAHGYRVVERQAQAETQITEHLRNAFRLAPRLKLAGNASLIYSPRATQGSTNPSASQLTEIPEPTTSVKPLQEHGVFELQYDYRGPIDKTNWGVKFTAVSRIDELVGRLSSEVFDDVIIATPADNEAAVIYQQSTSEPELLKLGFVKNRNGKEIPFTEVMFNPDVYQVNFGGTQYKLFVQPIEFGSPNAHIEPRGPWSLCGLVRADRFRHESFAVPSTMLLLFLFGFILVMFCSPLIKLWTSGPTDRLTFADFTFVCISSLTIVSLITLFLLDVYAYERLAKQLDAQVERLSTDIQTHFDAEVKQLADLLRKVNDAVPRGVNGNVEIEYRGSPDLQTSILCSSSPCCDYPKNCGRLTWVPSADPYFDFVTLIRAGKESEQQAKKTEEPGQQVKKWTIETISTALINVSKRTYFRAINEERGWTRKIDKQNFTFFIEPISSFNTGEVLALMSTPVPPRLSRVGPPAWIATVTAKLISLQNTVVPPGFGYAVIDQSGAYKTGDVLFHSNPIRTLSENFVEECDNDSELRAMVLTRGRGWISARYRGSEHRLYVVPLEGVHWSLIVFRATEVTRTANLELLSAALILSVICGVVFVLPVLLLCLRRTYWLWPEKSRVVDYCHLLAADVGLVILLLFEFSFINHHHVPLLAFIVPPFALVLTRLKLGKDNPRSVWWARGFVALLILLPIVLSVAGWQDSGDQPARMFGYLAASVALYATALLVVPGQLLGKTARQEQLPTNNAEEKTGDSLERLHWLSASTAYVLLGVLLAVIIGVLPSAIFFRLAYDGEMEILVKHGQYNVDHALVDRERRIKTEYGRVEMPDGYLARRLKSPQDTYTDFFFDTRLKQGVQDSERSPCNPPEPLFDRAIEMMRPLYNEGAVQTHTFVHDTSGDCGFVWQSRGREITLGSQELGHFIMMTSVVPLLAWPDSFWWWLGLIVASVLFLSGIYAVIRIAARRIFFLDQFGRAEPCGTISELGEITENTLLLGKPQCGRAKLMVRSGCHRIDIREIAATGTWRNALDEDIPEQRRIVAMNHLEYEMEDGECNTQKLLLLEKYLYGNRIVVAETTVDPMGFTLAPIEKTESKTPGENNQETAVQKEERARARAQLKDRWVAVWSTFRRVDGMGEGDIKTALKELENALRLPMELGTAEELMHECVSREQLCRIGVKIASHKGLKPEHVISEVLNRARAYYRMLWSTCTQEERIALLHLAQDGFVSAPRAVLQGLRERGLLVVPSEGHPRLSLFNHSFRQFVMNLEPGERAIASRKESSPWAVVRGTLIVGLIGVALIIFLSQPEMLKTSQAFIGAVAASIPALLKLFGLIRGAGEQQ